MQKTVNKASERKAAYIFILPAVVLLAAFLIYPSLQTVRYAFTDYNIMRPDRIVFCGQMTHAQLLPVVAGSEALLVYTSKDNNMVSIVESIAVGTPVVTTSVPYNAAYIRREQLGIAEDDWTEEALIKIVEDNGLYRQNCLRYRRKLSNTFCAERFMDVRASSEGS